MHIFIQKHNYFASGRIDIVLVVGDTIYVCDYKPDLNPTLLGKGSVKQSDSFADHFIDSIPQVTGYVRALMQRSGLKNVVGITFNKDGLWAYTHNFLNKIENVMIKSVKHGGLDISDEIEIWKNYIHLPQPWSLFSTIFYGA